MSEVQEVQQEETPNPYNMRKEYSGQQDAPFQSADGVYHPPTQATSKAAPDEENSNYKKRYDDLKKHYDTKINEFKQKEQELQAEARMTQQVEQAVSHEDKVEAEQEVQDEYVEATPVVETRMTDSQHLKSVKPRLHVKKQNKRFTRHILTLQIFAKVMSSIRGLSHSRKLFKSGCTIIQIT